MKIDLQSMRRQDVPLHVELASVLRNQILSGELPSGSKLPTLRALSEDLGVARMTIIQAMNSLQAEGLIERYSGKGTFVSNVPISTRYKLQMQADINQIYAMVDQMEVFVEDQAVDVHTTRINDREFRNIRRTHRLDNKLFCHVDLCLDSAIFDLAPERFMREIVVSVLKDIDVSVASAKQRITITYADFDIANSLGIAVNSALFRVTREFYDDKQQLIYSALLVYPGDLLELEIDFTLS